MPSNRLALSLDPPLNGSGLTAAVAKHPMTYSNLCACPVLLRNEPVKTTLNLSNCCATLITCAAVHSHVNTNNETNKAHPISDCDASTRQQKQKESSTYLIRIHHSSRTIKSTHEASGSEFINVSRNIVLCLYVNLNSSRDITFDPMSLILFLNNSSLSGLPHVLCTAQVRLI